MINTSKQPARTGPDKPWVGAARYAVPLLMLLVLQSLLLVARGHQAGTADPLRILIADHGVTPLDPGPAADPALVALGEALFFDKELSGNRDIACATCHHPSLSTGDGLPVSIGTGGHGLGPDRVPGAGRTLIPRNAPELYNRGSAAWHTMFWDGRALTDGSGYAETPAGDQLPAGLDSLLAIQALFPVTSADEMRGASGDLDVLGQPNELADIAADDFIGMWDGLLVRLLAIPEYVDLFAAAYPDTTPADLHFAHAANALAAYQATAFAQFRSPWHAYLQGDDNALTEEEKEGARLFFGEAGCAQCHSGPLLTDQAFHNVATPQVGPGKGEEAPFDYGRYRVTGDRNEMFAFRTPSLHNVAVTGPWFHSGAYSTLEAVVRHHLNPEAALFGYDATAHLPAGMQEMVVTNPALLQIMVDGLDPALAAIPDLTDTEVDALLAFLHALTDPAVFDLAEIVPESVPSGLPVAD